MIKRQLADILKKDFFRGKVLAIMGARQTGKTTLIDQLDIKNGEVIRFNCDDHTDAEKLEHPTLTDLHNLLDNYRYVLIDEAQRVKDIGLTLKMIADTFKNKIQVVVSGSSSFDLSNELNEPATGRMLEYMLYPLSMSELAADSSWKDVDKQLETRLIYGCYPEVVTDPAHARQTLNNLTNNYLYKDILSYKGMRKPDVLVRLLQALALQIGSEVSYSELGRTVGIDKTTIENYIDLLEKCFVIYKVNSLSRNMRKEILKGKKIYFVDNGVRNALIRNFSPLHLRQDTGMLWENFIMSERRKYNTTIGNDANIYFWRTHDQKEIDLIEEKDGRWDCFEFKFNPNKKAKLPAGFSESYSNSSFTIVNPSNYRNFIS